MSSVKGSPATRVLNASDQSLSKIARITCPGPRSEVAILNVDGNNLATLVGLQCYPGLIQLSACNNSIVKMDAIHCGSNLVTLNLQGNSISEISGLDGLANLQWVSLAGNTISSMEGLSSCVKLNYLDLSENCIADLSNITSLTYLKTLLLHGNAIASLRSVPECLPRSITTLSLAENEVSDLNEVSFLRGLHNLEQMSFLSNPCVSIMDARLFDFRPYILFWCPRLTTLDGVDVNSEERENSRTLFPPGRPYPFAVGEHHVLVHYLASIYPLVTSELTIPTKKDLQPPTVPVSCSPSKAATQAPSTAAFQPPSQTSIKSPSKLTSVQSSPSKKTGQLPPSQTAVQQPPSQTAAAAPSKATSQPPTSSTTTTSSQPPSKTPAIPTSTAAGGKSMEVSLSELEGLLTQSADSADHSGLVQKLRALQLVEEMIATQTQLITSKDGGVFKENLSMDGVGRQGKAPEQLMVGGNATKSPPRLRAESAVHKGVAPPIAVSPNVTPGVQKAASPIAMAARLPVESPDDALATRGKTAPGRSELVTENGGVAWPWDHSLMKVSSSSSGLGSSVASGSANSLNLQERRQQQLKLINQRLAKRHSNLPWKDTPTQGGLSTQTTGTAVKKVPTQLSKRSKVVESKGSFESEKDLVEQPVVAVGSPVGKAMSTQPTLSQEVPGRSVAWKPNPVPDETDSALASSISSKQTGVFSTNNPLPDSFADEALPSETSFLPVTSSGFSEQGFYGSETMTSQDKEVKDTDHYVNSLLSSLTSAYGYSSLAEKSRLLNSLVVSEKSVSEAPRSVSTPPDRNQEAITIQSAYRGHLARKKCRRYLKDAKAATLIQAAWRGYVVRKRDPEVVRVRAELSRIRLESRVLTLQKELKSCRAELDQQVCMSRLHEEQIQTLQEKVEELKVWRREGRERERTKAAVVLQKYWRGHATRKQSGCRFELISRRESLWMFCCSLQQQVHQLQSRLAQQEDGGPLDTQPSHATVEASMLPGITDLQMTHYSEVCVLLRWTPPTATPDHAQLPARRGYRVYVNGSAEGMVGPDKRQAYIEGLDMDTTYRITVRVLYSSGESKDSNPIIASLYSGAHNSSASVQGSAEPLPVNSDPSGPPPPQQQQQQQEETVPDQRVPDYEQSRVASTTNTTAATTTDHQFQHQLSGNDSLGRQGSTIPESAASLCGHSTEKPDLGVIAASERALPRVLGSNGCTHDQGFGDELGQGSGGGVGPLPLTWGSPDTVDPDRGHVDRVSSITRSTSSVIGNGGGGGIGATVPSYRAWDPNQGKLNSGLLSPVRKVGFGQLDQGEEEEEVEGGWAGKGDCVSVENGQMKPCGDKPTLERVMASGVRTLTTASLLSRTSASPPSTSVHSSSPRVDVGLLLQEATLTPSSAVLDSPLPLSRHSSSHHCRRLHAESAPLLQQVPSVGLFNTTSPPKMTPPPLALTDVTSGPGLGLLGEKSSSIQADSDNSSVATDDTSGRATYRIPLDAVKTKMDALPKARPLSVDHRPTSASNGFAVRNGIGGTTVDSVGVAVSASLSTEDSSCGGGQHLHAEDATWSGCRLNSGDDDPSSGGSGGVSSSAPWQQCLDQSTANSPSSANRPRAKPDNPPLNCKQPPKLPTDRQQCFEAGGVDCSLPRRDGDSIISLGEATVGLLSTADNAPASSAPPQTMPSTLIKESDQAKLAKAKGGAAVGGSNVLDGNNAKVVVEEEKEEEEGVRGQAEDGDMVLNSSGSSSQLMASLLLSQLETELTQSLHTQN